MNSELLTFILSLAPEKNVKTKKIRNIQYLLLFTVSLIITFTDN